MSKADRILDQFPAFYRAADRTKLLAEIVHRLAQPLEEADTHLFRIQRAHRIKVAEHAEDIIRLAAALNLTAFHFEDILADKVLDYDHKLDLIRERVQRVARLHLQGLGTPWAVLEGAAIFLNATIVPDSPDAVLVHHLDAEAFSHRVTVEFGHLPERPRERFYLHENPLRRNKVEPAERWQLNSWAVTSRNVGATPLKLVIRGVSDHTVLPSIFCPATQEGIFFNGVIPAGSTLVVDRITGALLDDQPVDDWLVHFTGGVFEVPGADGSWFEGAQGSDFVIEDHPPGTPFDGDLADVDSRPFRRRAPVPMAQHGSTQWYFKVAEGRYDGNNFDYAVFATNPEPIGVYDGDFAFDGSVFDYPAAGVVGMAWDERIPCAFKLLLPAQLPRPKDPVGTPADGPPTNHLSRVDSLMPRFKAAGIRAYVDTAKDAWILGESLIRSAGANKGDGVERHATRLRSSTADILVSSEVNP
jgi:hypothetical protein